MNPMRMKESAARRGERALSTNGAEIISKRYPNPSKNPFPSINVLGTSLDELDFILLPGEECRYLRPPAGRQSCWIGQCTTTPFELSLRADASRASLRWRSA